MYISPSPFPLPDGRTLTLRSPDGADADAFLVYLRRCAEETEFLTRYPEEIDFTPEAERELLACYRFTAERPSLPPFIRGVVG